MANVEISLAVYEDLIRESERLAIIERMAERETCIFTKDLRPILDIRESEVGNNDV